MYWLLYDYTLVASYIYLAVFFSENNIHVPKFQA